MDGKHLEMFSKSLFLMLSRNVQFLKYFDVFEFDLSN